MTKKQPKNQDDPRRSRGTYFLALLAGGSRPVLYGGAFLLLGVLLSAVYALSPNVKSTMWKMVFLAPLATFVAWILYVCSPFASGKRVKTASSRGTITGAEKGNAGHKPRLDRQWFLRCVIPASVIAAGLVWVIDAQHRLEVLHAAILFAVLFIASVQLIGIVRRHGHARRCGACGKSWALKRTGERTESPNPQEEWRCRHCSWTIWIDEVHGDMQGGHGGGISY